MMTACYVTGSLCSDTVLRSSMATELELAVSERHVRGLNFSSCHKASDKFDSWTACLIFLVTSLPRVLRLGEWEEYRNY